LVFWFATISVSALLGYSARVLVAQPDHLLPQTPNFTNSAPHPDLEVYYQTRKAQEALQGQPTVTVNPLTAQSFQTRTNTGVAVQTTDFIAAFADLGGTLGALGFASWLVVFLLRQHDTERQAMRQAFTSERSRVQEEREKERAEFAAERQLHLNKDSSNDEAMRISLEKSQENLLNVVHANQQQMSDLKSIMQTQSQDLKGILLELKMGIATGFERIHEKWDGSTERRGSGRTDRRARKAEGEA